MASFAVRIPPAGFIPTCLVAFAAIWLNPWYDNVDHRNERETYDGQAITDYHGYGAVDFYAVDEHLGTLDKLRELVEAAHALGILCVAFRQKLQRDTPAQVQVFGEIDFSHPAPAQLAEHAVVRERLADHIAPGATTWSRSTISRIASSRAFTWGWWCSTAGWCAPAPGRRRSRAG